MVKDKENPNYYAILTAEVRYSKNINANEKLLFAEITALANKTGECWASNNYYKNGTKQIEKRLIQEIIVWMF